MDPKMFQKSLRAAGIRFQNPCEFWSGLGRGPGGPLEKRRSNDAGSAARRSAPWQSQGYGLRRQSEGVARAPPWTTAALPDFRPSGTGRQRRRQALGTCGLSRRKFGAQTDPAMLMMPAAYPIRTL